MVSCDMSDATWRNLLQDQGGNIDSFVDWWQAIDGLRFCNSLENGESTCVILSGLEQDMAGTWQAILWKDPMFCLDVQDAKDLEYGVPAILSWKCAFCGMYIGADFQPTDLVHEGFLFPGMGQKFLAPYQGIRAFRRW